VIAGTPADSSELVGAWLNRHDGAAQSNERERARLIDAYQVRLLEVGELTRHRTQRHPSDETQRDGQQR
jgi:hypothetical protein